MKRIRFTAVAALFLAAAMLLTSCAGDSSTATTVATTAAATTAAATTAAGATTAATTTAAATTAAITAAASDGPVTAAGCLPIVNEMIDLEIMMAVNTAVSDYENNDMTRKMEEMTNIHINWNMVADMATTKPLLLASGDLPEVFGNAGMTAEEQMTYSEKGVFIDQKPYIDQYGYYIMKMFDYDTNVEKEITLPSGMIVSLPSYSLTYHMTAANKLWMNRDWLAAVNMSAPTTVEEFYDVLTAFKTGDPNGNGQNDEIPFTGVDVSGWHSVVPYVMAAYIVTDNQEGRYFAQPYAGTVDIVFDKDVWREGLTYLNKLYSEGLIDPECFTQDIDLRKQKVEAGQIGATGSNAPSSFAVADSEMFKVYDAIEPLIGTDGARHAAYTGTPIVTGFFTITRECKNPEAAFRWADFCYNEEYNCDFIYGNEGAQWRKAEDGETGINGKQAIFTTLEGFSGVNQNVSWYQTIHNFRTAEWRLGDLGATEETYYLRAGMESRIYDATTLYEPYYTTDIVPVNLYVPTEDAKEYSDIKTALYDYMKECTARFITGDMSIDAEWDSYIAELDHIGLDRYLELVASAIN
ncbi:MAG: extracellular solute-binding protein [Clostridiaceae bacterium]|nr:extracellular solute-binding protein [Clostridiaceae bacterium]